MQRILHLHQAIGPSLFLWLNAQASLPQPASQCSSPLALVHGTPQVVLFPSHDLVVVVSFENAAETKLMRHRDQPWLTCERAAAKWPPSLRSAACVGSFQGNAMETMAVTSSGTLFVQHRGLYMCHDSSLHRPPPAAYVLHLPSVTGCPGHEATDSPGCWFRQRRRRPQRSAARRSYRAWPGEERAGRRRPPAGKIIILVRGARRGSYMVGGTWGPRGPFPPR